MTDIHRTSQKVPFERIEGDRSFVPVQIFPNRAIFLTQGGVNETNFYLCRVFIVLDARHCIRHALGTFIYT